MRSPTLCSAVLAGISICWAQTPGPVLLGAGNHTPFPLALAPGELVTLFVQPATAISRWAAYTVSAGFVNGPSMPVVQVVEASTGCNPPLSGAPCTQVLAVTVQIPFGIPLFCTLCAPPLVSTAGIDVSVNGVTSPTVIVQPFQDHVHFLTTCDIIVAGANSAPPSNGGLPCTPMVTHHDGSMVSNFLPAKVGEELVAYATGLGETNPALTGGQPAAQSSPTVTTFGIEFNYRLNALATELFTGATKSYVCHYQINFIVPPPPAGFQPCVDTASIVASGNYVRSNLTVSVGSSFSFDGAGICVEPLPTLGLPASA